MALTCLHSTDLRKAPSVVLLSVGKASTEGDGCLLLPPPTRAEYEHVHGTESVGSPCYS